MKHSKKVIMVVTLVFLMGIISCASKIGDNLIDKGEVVKTQKWVDDDTFRIIGIGAPMSGETSKLVRKATAKEAAILHAQMKIVEKFFGTKIESAVGMKNFRISGIAAAKSVEGAIKGGSVHKAIFDPKNQEAVIIYEVKVKGLKNKLTEIRAHLKKNNS